MLKKLLFVMSIWGVGMAGREIKEGALYRHYRGGLYRVVKIAYNTGGKPLKTLNDVDNSIKSVVYEPVEPHPALGQVTWVRAYEIFNEKIVIDGVEQYRFDECEQ